MQDRKPLAKTAPAHDTELKGIPDPPDLLGW
jgi:hypothetical protein